MSEIRIFEYGVAVGNSSVNLYARVKQYLCHYHAAQRLAQNNVYPAAEVFNYVLRYLLCLCDNAHRIDLRLVGVEAVLCHSDDVILVLCSLYKPCKAQLPCGVNTVKKHQGGGVFLTEFKEFHPYHCLSSAF